MGVKSLLLGVLIGFIMGFFLLSGSSKTANQVLLNYTNNTTLNNKEVIKARAIINNINTSKIKTNNNIKSIRDCYLGIKNIPEKYLNVIKEECYNGTHLNLACVAYLMHDVWNFSYKEDKGDVLFCPDQFFKNKGGDCEDWSFFMYSLIKYLNISSIITYIPNGTQNLTLYTYNNTIYHVPNVTVVLIDIKNGIPVVYCYDVNETMGHCVIGITNKSINPIKEEIPSFPLMEPQTGEYLGYTNYTNVSTIIYDDKIYEKVWYFWTVGG